MRVLSLIILLVLFTTNAVFSQAPNEFKYQTVLFDASGNTIANQNVTLDVSILLGSSTGISIFNEIHNVTTNPRGMISITVGSIDDLSLVDFNQGNYFIQLKMNNEILGVNQLLSVPYSISSQTTETVEFTGIINKPTTIVGYGITDAFNGSWIEITGKPITIAGYGITDAFSGSWGNVIGTPTTMLGYGITDAFDGQFGSLINKPTTISGYGITDAFDGNWSNVTNTPTTIEGYNIVDDFSGNYNDLSDKPSNASTSEDGFMSSEDKLKLNNLQNLTISVGVGVEVTGSYPDLTISAKPHIVGELFEGGIVVWVDNTGEHGLICSLIDVSPGIVFSDVSIPGAQSDWDGVSNTNEIVNQPGFTTGAAQVCLDYTNTNTGTGVYSDWYLPSSMEFSKIWNGYYAIQRGLGSDGNPSSTPFEDQSIYYSSTQSNEGIAAHYFRFGAFDNVSRFNEFHVRAFRMF